MNPIISIVSGTYNRLPLLQKMIESARASLPRGIPYEIILVDGGSTDGTIEWCLSQPDIQLIQHGELRGAINAFTEGAQAARGKLTCLLNDDVEVVGDSLLRAIVHLENNAACGAVAMADNRHDASRYLVMKISAMKDGVEVWPYYAQCGVYRTWLGNALNWWRGHDPRFAAARTYGGDSLLSANILEAGYTVDAVDGVRVTDHVADDDLRRSNMAEMVGKGEHPDSTAYYTVFPPGVGPVMRSTPQIASPDKRQLRILYLPIIEPGPFYERARATKVGLRNALAKQFLVYEYDYLGRFYMQGVQRPQMMQELLGIMDTFQPDMMLAQFHAADIITTPMLQELRIAHPRMVVVNWNGDAWPWSLTGNEVMAMLRHVDLQLVVNPHVLPKYTECNIAAGYWQIGYEEAGLPLPTVAAHDVLFLGNHYGEVKPDGLTLRGKLGRTLQDLRAGGIDVGIYGGDWDKPGVASNGNTLYDFAAGDALMQAAKIVIGDNQFPEQPGFVSNRILQALAVGGALLLHQRVGDLELLTGLQSGTHYVEFTDFADLQDKIRTWLAPAKDKARRKIAKAGAAYVREHHSFDARVRELFTDLLPLARRDLSGAMVLRFMGKRTDQFGIRGPASGAQYVCNPERELVVQHEDGERMLQLDAGLWQRVDLRSSIGEAS